MYARIDPSRTVFGRLGSTVTARAGVARRHSSRRGSWENALEPERVSDMLHRNTFWQGRAAP